MNIYYHRFDKNMDSNCLIKAALDHFLIESGREADREELVLVREHRSKKPYLRDYPDIFYNVSHSGEWWVASFGFQENGLDLQKVQEKSIEKLAQRYFHPKEIAWLTGREKAQYYRIWAYNESYVKYTGDGLTRALNSFSVIEEDQSEPGMRNEKVYQQEIPFPQEGYWLVLTTQKNEDVLFRPLECD